MRQTTFIKPTEVKRNWYVVDADGQTLGRLASEIAILLRGKHKVDYTPHVDCGDYVIVINADKAVVSGDQEFKKMYYRHTGYPGGLKTRSTGEMRRRFPQQWVEKAIMGMLPHTRLGDAQRTHLYVYTGDSHPHQAQQPIEYKLKG
ncbi:MAG TPA: 50S ribosomal protein L13 [Erysipelothrix sp.]|jgi:large subunit ribosomal protein L13|nr:50S ribosomal protein L13 [Erysipelothrix sp.]HHX53260.1 50S ribosomal protein L13 [Erysipelothrix sp.]